MKTYPNKKYKFDPKNPPNHIVKDLDRLEKLIEKLEKKGVYFMADGSLHAFARYKDGTKDVEYLDAYTRINRPYDEAKIATVSENVDGGDFW